MPALESLTAADLTFVGLSDSERGLRIVRGLAGQGVTDDVVDELLPTLFEALQKSPDPDRALNNFARWTEAVISRYTHFQYLLKHPAALDIFFNVCGVSQLFSDILVRNPEYFEILANPGVRGGGADRAKPSSMVYRELSGFVNHVQRAELKLEAMRRFKQREILRIGTRDILELADMPTTAREFTNLADACIQKIYEIAVAALREKHGVETPPPFAVVGMGKLGGQELNYSSDIDLMFVCGDEIAAPTPDTRHPTPLTLAHTLAELIINAISSNTQNGHLFRVDVRLRPEGRFGALVRTLSSYKAYYESWAEPWERQSLLKARAVAGDTRLGEAFSDFVRPYVYRRSVTSDFVEAIRQNKERIEQKAEIDRVKRTNVKIGYGGIRDIEFTAQLLQLRIGGRDARVRTSNTLDALARLRQVGALSYAEAADLSGDYQFLRTVEHRLQILYERQTQSLPTDPIERNLLARRLGYSDAKEFDAEYARRTERVHGHFERLFYGERGHGGSRDIWRELLENVETPHARTSILYALEAEGFHEPERAYNSLKGVVDGNDYGQATPEVREQFLRMAGRIIDSCGRTGAPDAALQGLETLAHAMPNPAPLYRTLAEGDEILDRFCRLSAASLPLVQSLGRHLQWLDLLVSDEIIDQEIKTADRCREELYERTVGVGPVETFWDTVALYVQRERLRIGARDVWGEIGPQGVALELTNLADAVIGTVLNRAVERALAETPGDEMTAVLSSIAVIGLGKLGGRELGYGSDWDILFVYDRAGESLSPAAGAALNRVTEHVLAAGQFLRPRGAAVEIDARLRPEGSVGALAYTPAEYRDYYLRSALTWERQVLTRARPIAGSEGTGSTYMRAVHEAVYGTPLSDDARNEIQVMKRRIEKERLKPEERNTDIKLGHGGLSDIEFTVQMLQMREGARHPQVRVPGTADALHALAAIGAIQGPDAMRLAETHAYWIAIRNRLSLLGGFSTDKLDTLPSDSGRLRALAVGLGAADTPRETAAAQFQRRFEERMHETRQIVERLFYRPCTR